MFETDSPTADAPTSTDFAPYNVEAEVNTRYAAGAEAAEAELCCPVDYDPQYLKLLPQEIIDRDYGCGDPSKHVGVGETALDLGSGGGKICYILAQKVGAAGTVIGVDFNDAMLGLARQYQPEMAEKLGYDNVSFRKGRIQDLRLDLAAAQTLLDAKPITSIEDAAEFEAATDKLRHTKPLVADSSVDVVVSNCVLNLVKSEEKAKLFGEIFRVLKRGGRAVISDIVCDEPPTDKIMNDPSLWSGCISGAFQELEFLRMFEEAGFYGVEVLERQEQPWRTIDGIEFRSLTVRAYKGKQGPCMERNQAVVYAGPWKQVKDDDNHTFFRGQRMAVCDKTFKLMTDPNGPYAGQMLPVEPLTDVPLEASKAFDCARTSIRHPRETKGLEYRATTEAAADCCGPDGCC